MPILTLAPHLSERPWGGTYLRSYGEAATDAPIGEAWVIAAHANGVSTVTGGTGIGAGLVGLGLDTVWAEHREFFGGPEGDRFPLLTKIIDAQDWLSLQLHPSDEEAPAGDLGKAECWYVIGAEPGAQLVHGINETDPAKAKERILNSDFEGFFSYYDVHVGDFFDVPTGLVHGIGPGVLILETQQNSDSTFRIYDWDRPGLDGKLRDLHLEESAACVRTTARQGTTQPTITQDGGVERRFYVTNDYFTVEVWDINGDTTQLARPHNHLILVSVVDGSLTINDGDGDVELGLGESAIIGTGTSPLTLTGSAEAVISWPS